MYKFRFSIRAQVRKNSVPPSAGGAGKVAHISYILGLLRNANLTPVTCEVLSVKGHQTRLKNMIGKLTALSWFLRKGIK